MSNIVESISHIRARAIINTVFARVLGRKPSRLEALLTQAWALVESTYGTGWRGAGQGSNNWGAIQVGSTWKGEAFLTGDTSPQPDGTSKPYKAHYRKYDTPEAGAEDLVCVLYVGRHRGCLEFATRGDLAGFVRGLRATTYFEGRGATTELQVWHRRWQMLAACIRIGRELAESLPDGSASPRTFDEDAVTAAVDPRWLLCARLGHSSVRELQRESHPALEPKDMPVDGVCGPATWALLLLRAEEELGRDTSSDLCA